jgi:glycosyltransferase involved in cell wall biosynthesis
MKLLFIGGINVGNYPRGGEEYKNQLILKMLEMTTYKSTIIDTHQWKNSLSVCLNLVFNVFLKKWDTILISASSLSTYRLLKLIDLLRPIILEKTTYLVIGGYFPEGIKEKRYNWLVYSKLKNVIVEGELLKNALLKYSKLKNISVLPNFKDFPEQIVNYKDSGDEFRFVYLGRISKSKGIYEILGAAADIYKNNTKVSFVVDFYGPMDDEIEFKHSFISYKGSLDFQNSPEDSYHVLSKYDCLLFPTYWVGEGFPGVLIDAFVVGLPVIASDWNMNRELIEEGVNGFIIPPKSKDSLTEKMTYVINNKVLLNEIRRNNILKSESYHANVVWAQLLDLLKL